MSDSEPSEMVERVARAMWQSEWDRSKAQELVANAAAGRDVYVCYVPKWEDCNLRFLSYARAAIEAMRMPTGGMIEAACEIGPDTNSGPFDDDSARLIYEAMIDAALSSSRDPAPSN